MTQDFVRTSAPSPSLRNILLFFFTCVVVTFAVLFIPESANHRLARARQYMSDWDLMQAEQLLEDLTPSPEATELSAEVALKRGNLKKSLVLLSLLVAQDSSKNPHHLMNLAFAHYYLGNLDSAASLARQVVLQQQDSTATARAYNLLGLVDFNAARYKESWQHQEQSLAVARARKNVQAEADAMRQLGVLEWYRGRHDTALVEYYQPALELYLHAGDKIGEATTLSNIGLIHLDRGQWAQELAYQMKAFEIRKRIGDLRGIADSYYFLSTSGILSKGRTFSYNYRMKSLELSTRIGYAWGREVAARSLEDLLKDEPWFVDRMGHFKDSVFQMSGEGKLYAEWHAARQSKLEGKWQECIRLYENVIRICDSLQYVIGRNVAYQEYGVALMSSGRYGGAEAALVKSRALSRLNSWAFTDNELGELYLLTGRPRRAQQILVPVLRNLDSTFTQALPETNPSRFFGGSLRSVFQHRSRAYALLLTALRNDTHAQTFKIMEQERSVSFWGEQRSLSENPQTALGSFIRSLERLDAHPEEFQSAAEVATRVGELQQEMAVEQGMFSQSSAGRKDEPPSPRDVQQSLGTDEAFLEYAVGFREILLFCITREQTKLFRIEADLDQLRSKVETLRESISRGKEDPADDVWKQPAAALYRDLLRPARSLIAQKGHLIVSANEFLVRTPFHALLDPSGTPVIGHSAFSYVPSAAFLVKSRKLPVREARTLTALAPLSDLLFSRKEVEGIPQEMFTQSRILDGSQATSARLLSACRETDVIHIASHARMNNRFPFYSFIECADRRIELHEILRTNISAKLVFLSACETGENVGAVSDDLSSENSVSFPRAFMSAGASSVIASSWLVDDESTSSLARLFYEALKLEPSSSSRLARSLASAQRQLIVKSGVAGKQSHPFYWAPFFLVGDSR